MFGLGVALLIGMVATSLWLVQANNKYSQETAELRRIRASILDVLTTIQDAETGQRGYLLTSDERYLAPYQEALKTLGDIRQRLAERIGNRPEYIADLPKLQSNLDAKMAEIGRAVQLMNDNRTTEAIDLVRSDTGLTYMREIRDTLTHYQETTDNRLRIIVADQLSAAENLLWVTICGAVAILGVLGGALALIAKYIRELTRSREEVDELNRGLEERVDERTRDLVRANQEIQKFAYIVTHDLRAPLVNIMGFLSEFDTSLKPVQAFVLADGKTLSENEVREARLAVEEDLPEAMRFIRSSTRKMDQLINAILKISRDGRRKLQAEKVDLKDILTTASASVQHQVTAVDGKIDIDIQNFTVITDRISLDQILGNLFDNAVKYQMPGRPLELTARILPQGRGIVRIDVSDNGRGIAEDDLERVFELFRRAGEQDQQGEGIGLAHVRSLIRNLGGDITVASELGKGSTFHLTLPTDLRKITRGNDI
ncbi:CHASE3 domain-containing protein [Agrobacterium rosae]|uniref:sensor histidine kinase n=1 Tax=Agrobacterium rosae TaxID=1972867 RepID=UPI0019D37A87|nr:ATP-binding protein [Agrobacterium rosae]MBN7803999.1 CHASE3 domain-containing protein [Agrobacterium rosae]MDX8312393.1 CHASE3 domain-containing protein [Agrobacterium rosae]